MASAVLCFFVYSVAVWARYATILVKDVQITIAADMDDNEIITLFFSRNETAIDAVKKKYGAYYRAVINGILDSPEDREECADDVLMALWNNIPPQRPENLKGYICRLARNISISRFRKNSALMRGKDRVTLAMDELDLAIPSGLSIEDELIRKELIEAINDYLRSKDERSRNIFLCRYYYFRKSTEIASDTGMSDSHVRTILSRMRTELKAYISKRGLL